MNVDVVGLFNATHDAWVKGFNSGVVVGVIATITVATLIFLFVKSRSNGT